MTAKLRPAAGAASGAGAASAPGAGAASGAGAGAGRVRSPRLVLLAAVLVAVLAGCGSTAAGTSARASAPAAIRLPLTTTMTESGGTSWAVIDMGGSGAKLENFWQLFARPALTRPARTASAASWSLATPPGVADNGGLVAAPLDGPALVTGFNPSQDLTFSPLATTRDGGARWAPGLLPAGLAAVPSALAAGPGGRLIALTNRGLADITAARGAGWTRLASLASLAATPAARSCGLRSVTAAAFSPAGVPLLAGQCAAPGVAGIFAFSGGSWHPAGPALPAALAQRRISVLRLAAAGRSTIALLTATAPGGAASLTAGWAAAGGRWALSAPLPLDGARILSTATGTAFGGYPALAASVAHPRATSAAGVILSTGRGETITDHQGGWQLLPALPPHATALVLGPGRELSVLAASGSILTSWRPAARAVSLGFAWTRTQTVRVPVPYGSSG
jgi:hypothetical protein